MQTTRRDHGRTALAGFIPPPFPPPPPPMRLVKNTNEVRYPGLEGVDPKALEDAVLRILRKHAAVPAEEAVEIEDEFLLPLGPSRGWRLLRAVLVVALLAGATAFVLHVRYPAQARALAAVASSTGTRVARIKAWMFPVGPAPALPSAPPVAPAAPTVTSPALTTPALGSTPPTASVVAAPDSTTAPLAEPAPTALPVAPAKPSTVSAAPLARSVTPAVPRVSTDTTAIPASPSLAAHAAHPAPHPAVAPPSAAPSADASPIPGSLGDAIRRAGGTSATPALSDRAPAPEAKPSPDAAVPDRPSASLVQSALSAALPDARACMSPGDETRAIVIFDSSGAVSAVQVSGASAKCIQKAFGRARVPPFSQPTYRAGVPVRAN